VVTEGAYGLPDKTKVKIEKPETESGGEGAKDKDKGKDDDEKSKPDAGNKKAAQPKANGKSGAGSKD
jgi:hypothetical protein